MKSFFSMALLSVIVLATILNPVYAQDDAAPWAAVSERMDASNLDDMLLLVGTADGLVFTHSKGEIDPDDAYPIASASKWYTAVLVLRLVEVDLLALDDHPHDYLDFWTDDPNDLRSHVTVTHLLSFTSGFDDSSRCFADDTAGYTNTACVQEIYESSHQWGAGEFFFYGNAHMHILGVMVEAVTGMSYNAAFRHYVADPLGMSAATVFDFPSESNPMAAGGATSTAADYYRFVEALFNGTFLAESRDILFADHTADARFMYRAESTNSRDWHYSFGAWRECDALVWQPSCEDNIVVSSTGAFGFSPWIDVGGGHFGVLARYDANGERPSWHSVQLMRALNPLIEAAIAAE